MKEGFPERLASIIEQLADGNKSMFARELETSESNIRGYLTGIQPKMDFLQKIVSRFAISPEWLITGEGSMIKDKGKAAISQSIKGNNNTMSGHDTLEQKGDTSQTSEIISLYKKIIEEKEKQIRIKDEQIKKLLEIAATK